MVHANDPELTLEFAIRDLWREVSVRTRATVCELALFAVLAHILITLMLPLLCVRAAESLAESASSRTGNRVRTGIFRRARSHSQYVDVALARARMSIKRWAENKYRATKCYQSHRLVTSPITFKL